MLTGSLDISAQLIRENKISEALTHSLFSIVAFPEQEGFYNNLRIIYHRLNQKESEFILLKRVVEMNPNSAPHHCNLAYALATQDIKLSERALSEYNLSLRCDPLYTVAWHNRAILLKSINDLEKAIDSYRIALTIEPDLAIAWANLGDIYFEGDQSSQAIECLTHAVSIESKEAHFQYSLSRPIIRQLSHEDGQGRPLYVWSDGGYGDMIQFSRYLPLVAQKGWSIRLKLYDSLKRLFNQWPDHIMLTDKDLETENYHAHCCLLDLSLFFSLKLGAIPSAEGYLKAPQTIGQSLKNQVEAAAENKVKVGLCWLASYDSHSDRDEGRPQLSKKSIPLTYFTPLLALDSIAVFSLQKEQESLISHESLIDIMPQINDFADTAVLIDSLDLIISVDTSVAHLAGALGKPVWTLLKYEADNRWGKDKNLTEWYHSMRLYRQGADQNWDHVITALRRDLENFISLMPDRTIA